MEAILSDSGLLIPKENGKYEFLHRTYQEFLAGRWLMITLLDPSNSPLKENVKKFISENKYRSLHRTTFSFMAQEAGHNGIEALHEIFKIVDDNPMDVIGVQHVMMKARLLEAFLSASDPEKQRNACCDDSCVDLVHSVAFLPAVWEDDEEIVDKVLDFLKELRSTIKSFPRVTAMIIHSLKRRLALPSRDNGSVTETETKIFKFLEQYEWEMKKENLVEFPRGCSAFSSVVDEQFSNFFKAILSDNRTTEKEISLASILASQVPQAARKIVAMLSQLQKDGTHSFRQEVVKGIVNLSSSIENATMACIVLEEACKSDKDDVRLDAIRGIVKISERMENTGPAFNVLRHVYQSQSPYLDVRFEAIRGIVALSKFSEKTRDAFELLLTAYKDSDWSIRLEVIQSIAELSKTLNDTQNGFKVLAEALKEDKSWHVRLAAIKGIVMFSEFREYSVAVLNALSIAAKDKRSKIKIEYVRGIVKLASSDNVGIGMNFLLKACFDKDCEVRQEAILGINELSKMPNNEQIGFDYLLKACENEHFNEVRIEAIRGIIALSKESQNEQKGFDHLLTACTDIQLDYRIEAIRGVTELARNPQNTAKVFNALMQIWKSDVRWEIRLAAIKGIISFSESVEHKAEVLETLSMAAKEIRPLIRLEYVRGVISFPNLYDRQDGFNRLLDMCFDKESEVRIEAIRGIIKLSEIPCNEQIGVDSLLEACKDRHFVDVRIAALQAIITLSKQLDDGKKGFDCVLEACKDEQCQFRLVALRGIVELSLSFGIAESGFDILSIACSDEHSMIRCNAIRGIAELSKLQDNDIGINKLKEISTSSFWEVRLEAVRGIAELSKVSMHRERGFEILVKAFEDRHPDVRHEAKQGIVDLFALLPSSIKTVLELVFDESTRQSIFDTSFLEKCPVRDVIDMFLSENKSSDSVIEWVNRKLMDIVFASSKKRESISKLSLFDEGGKTEWDVSPSSVGSFDVFVGCLQGKLHQKYPAVIYSLPPIKHLRQ